MIDLEREREKRKLKGKLGMIKMVSLFHSLTIYSVSNNK
jgi:hypothetical protein